MSLEVELKNVKSFIERNGGATEGEVENTFQHYTHKTIILHYLRKAADGSHYHAEMRKFCTDEHSTPDSDSYSSLAAKTQ